MIHPSSEQTGNCANAPSAGNGFDAIPGTHPLTPRQLYCLEFITAYTDAHGFAPNFDEIKEGIGIASKSGVHRLVHGLAKRGWVDFIPGAWRSVNIIHRPALREPPLLKAWQLASASERRDFLARIGAL